MSMYTHLLGVARGQRRSDVNDTAARDALVEARRCREELKAGLPPGLDPDAVPVVLALEIGYDVALMDLATAHGVQTDPSQFEQPERERARLEKELAAMGVRLDDAEDHDAEVPA